MSLFMKLIMCLSVLLSAIWILSIHIPIKAFLEIWTPRNSMNTTLLDEIGAWWSKTEIIIVFIHDNITKSIENWINVSFSYIWSYNEWFYSRRLHIMTENTYTSKFIFRLSINIMTWEHSSTILALGAGKAHLWTIVLMSLKYIVPSDLNNIQTDIGMLVTLYNCSSHIRIKAMLSN